MSEVRKRHPLSETDAPTEGESTAVELKDKSKSTRCYTRSVIMLIIVGILISFLTVGLLCWHLLNSEKTKRPHVLMVIADDLGWADVGWHSSDIRTPTLTSLAKNGVILSQFYAQPLCTASRAALLTGRYPFKVGLQGSRPLLAGRIGSLPLADTLFPQLMQNQGYRTHMVGKWHLGFESRAHTPIMRGFHSFTGFYNGMQDYLTHTTSGLDTINGTEGYDMRRDYWDSMGKPQMENILWDRKGVHNNIIFNDEAIEIISKHSSAHSDSPLFLCMTYANPHDPIQVPAEFAEENQQIKSQERRSYANLVYALDNSVSKITATLKENGMFDDTIIIFISDNGGTLMTQFDKPTGASNYPLKGDKAGLWEGGTRVPAFIYGKGIPQGHVLKSLVHVTDIYPTIATLLDLKLGSQPLDGTDQSRALKLETSKLPKKYFIYDIDPVYKQAAIRFENWKLIIGAAAIHQANNRYPPLEEEGATYVKPGLPSDVYRAKAFGLLREYKTSGKMCRTVECFHPKDGERQVQLYDLSIDEFEFNNVAAQFPEVVKNLASILDDEMVDMAEPLNLIELEGEPAANPNNFNGAWMPWLP